MEPLGTATILLAMCVSFLLFFSTWRKRSGKGKLPPGPFAFPLIGNMLQLSRKNLPKHIEELSGTYGPIFTIYLGSEPVVVLSGYEILKETLINLGEEFSGRGSMPIFKKNTTQPGIIFSNGEQWKQLRRFALATLRNFGMGKKSIEKRIQEESHFLMERLRNTHGQPFDPTLFITHAVSNIICSIVFGNRFDYEDKKFVTLMSLIKKHNIQSSPWVAEQKNGHSNFHMGSLLQSSVELFFAGTGTTSTTLVFGLLILLKYPEIEEKVHEEINRVIGQSRSPCMADRSQMPYTNAVVHEIQRFIAIVPLGVPRAVTTDVHLKQYVIPKGTTIFPRLKSVLYDRTEFPNPEQFNPGHFLDENGAFKKSDFFMPFSTGKRICVGESLARMEIFLLLTALLQNFTLKPVLDPKDIDLMPVTSFITIAPKSYQLCVLPRERD
ncbi:cytochrome P450 2H1-like isoform X4 [Carettochelys insculpta]|uniref:cytochrome P450 2H1-like isoform X4 n=1 Tax=Carettochelys insculpta TaxID=44489 RepID=UPI003EC058C1